MTDGFDSRITPARGDIAAAHLRGAVPAERYVDGRACRVAWPVLPLRFQPADAARHESQLLYGESFTIYDEADGWAWGQAALDGYVGYVRSAALAAAGPAATHLVVALKAQLYPAADLKQPPAATLSLGSRLALREREGRWLRSDSGLWVFETHVRPLDAPRRDYLATAMGLRGVPYLWGGRSSDGLDCSAFVQLSLMLAGMAVPRDSDQQAASIGTALEDPQDLGAVAPGDVVFFPGHVGFLMDGWQFLHANAFDMQVAVHRFSHVLDRVRAAGGGVTAIRRPGLAAAQ